MNTTVLLALCGLVGVALAGGHYKKGPRMVPDSCAKPMQEHLDCLKDEKDKLQPPMDFTFKDVKECIKDCPKPSRPSRRGGRGKGFYRSLSEADKAAMQAFRECKHAAKDEILKPCVEGKTTSIAKSEIDFSAMPMAGLVHRHHRRHRGGRRGGKGKGFGRRGKKMMFDRIKKKMTCTPEVEKCVRDEVGDWMDLSMEDIKDKVCTVLKACPKPEKSEECMADKQAMKKAKCECFAEKETELMSKMDECKSKLPDSIRQHMEENKDKHERRIAHMKRRCERIIAGEDNAKSSRRKQRRGGGGVPRFCEDPDEEVDVEDDN